MGTVLELKHLYNEDMNIQAGLLEPFIGHEPFIFTFQVKGYRYGILGASPQVSQLLLQGTV